MTNRTKHHEFSAKATRQKCKSNCDNKKRYANVTMAMAVAYTSYEINPNKILYYYQCKICSGVHLSSRGGGSSVEIELIN